MMKYKISDIRMLNSGDIRYLEQFNIKQEVYMLISSNKLIYNFHVYNETEIQQNFIFKSAQ